MKSIKIFSAIILALTFQSCLSADEDPVKVAPITGQTLEPKIGGAAQGNQVWVKLSDASQSTNIRTDWDLAFYSGDQFRVILNNSIIMAVGKIPSATDINLVKVSDVAQLQDVVQIGTFDAANMQYIDNPNGNFLTQSSGISEIKVNDADNPIYLLNMGRKIYDGTIAPGSVITGGDSRGWKKIQILRADNGYKIRYADLNDKTYKEYNVTKSADHNFKFFSIENNVEVKVQPQKKAWDLGFTVFTNEVFTTTGQASGSYVFADFVVTNTLDGVGAYQVNVATGQTLDQAYNNFKMSDIDASKFIFNDQRAIGDHWRITTGSNGAQVYSNRFFVIKSADGFFFKLRFNRMTNNSGERGFPSFEYDPL